jgi:hypothetical protein
MQLANLDNVLWILSVVGQILLLLVLIQQRLYKAFPIFTGYAVFLVLSDPFFYLALRLLHGSDAAVASPGYTTYFKLYFALQAPQFLLELGVLLEIAANVLRPAKRSVPKGVLAAFAGLLLIGGSLTYFLTGQSHSNTLFTTIGGLYVKITFGMAILRLAFFTLVALFSQMLGIGWKSHVLQLSTGLALNAAVILLTQIAVSHLTPASPGSAQFAQYHMEFHLLDQVRIIGYLCTLAYWAWSFARQEAPRKEFSPQMAQFLVSISGAAKREHAALVRSSEK